MSRCIDEKIGKMLYAYELGILSDEDKQAMELHLIECEYCSKRANSFGDAARIIRHDKEFHEFVNSLAKRDEVDVGAEESVFGHKKDVKRRWVWALPLAAVVLLVLVLVDWEFSIHPRKEVKAGERRLTVLYFNNIYDPADTDHLGDIATHLIISNLIELKPLQITSGERLLSLYADLGYKKHQSLEVAELLAIAKKSSASWLLKGSILQDSPGIIITSELIDGATGNVIASQRVAGQSGEDIFAVVDRLSTAVKEEIPLITLKQESAGRPIAEKSTKSTEAYYHYLKGIEYKARNYSSEAIEEFEKALNYDSTLAMAYYYLAALKDPELIREAEKYSDKISRREKYHIDASFLLYKSDTASAILKLLELTKLYPNEAYAFWRLGKLYSFRNNIDSAIIFHEQAVDADKYYRNAYNDLAYLYEQAGNPEQSILAINRYIEIAPDEANPYDSRGDLYAIRGEQDKAIESYLKALDIKPDFYASREKLGHQYLFQQDYLRADSCYRILSESGDSFYGLSGQFWLVMSLVHRGDFNTVTGILDSLYTQRMLDGLYESAASDAFLESRIFTQLGLFDKAVEKIGNAVKVASTYDLSSISEYHMFNIEILAEAGLIDLARQQLGVLKTYLDENNKPEDTYWYARGSIEFHEDKFDQAIESLRRSQQQERYDVRYLLGRVYLANNQFSQAVKIFEGLLSEYTSERLSYSLRSIMAHYYLGRTYEESRWFGQAVEQYEIFLSYWEKADPQVPATADALERLKILRNIS